MGKLFREDGSPVKRADSDYHKYYQRARKLESKGTITPTHTKQPALTHRKADRIDYIRKPEKSLLLELRDSMIKKRMAKKLIKIIEDMI